MPIAIAVFFVQAGVNLPVSAKLAALIKMGGSFIVFAPVYFLGAYLLDIPEAKLIFRRKNKTRQAPGL